jgi:hypothetical protein
MTMGLSLNWQRVDILDGNISFSLMRARSIVFLMIQTACWRCHEFRHRQHGTVL